MSRKLVVALVTVVSVAACAFLIGVVIHKGMAAAGLWAAVVGALAGVVAVPVTVWVSVPKPPIVLEPPEPEAPQGVVPRPMELDAVVNALLDDQPGTVGITTGLYGAGGFGKTTLAQMVCADQRVGQRFGKFIYPVVTVGRDVRGPAAIAAKVNDVIKLVAGENATFTDPQLAGARLGSLLDAGPARLLVIDDVWDQDQVGPFLTGGKACARLVTTRVPELLAGRGTAVRVDQMSPEQAQGLLTFGLPPLDPTVARELLAVTGRWPLLLQLVNRILADSADVSAQGAALLEALAAGGPAIIDDLLSETGLDMGRPQERSRAVRATIGASASLLGPRDAERFAELSVFAEDETIPSGLMARFWRATAGLDDLHATQVRRRLVQLGLVSHTAAPAGGITVHDVVRDFLQADLGKQRLTELNSILLDALAADLPSAEELNHDVSRAARVAWWEMGDERYMWDHLIEHLLVGERFTEAEDVACDLRWVGGRLERFGPAAPAADLAAVRTPRAARLHGVLVRTAHLLASAEPAGAVVDVLHSRVAGDPEWGRQVTALSDICRRPRLVNRWPLPDLADPALRRVLPGHDGTVTAVAVAPDGSWLAASSYRRPVRIWDPATGQERAELSAGTTWVKVVVTPDGTWLATDGWDGRVRIWDAATGRERAELPGRADTMTIAPDGSWLATRSRKIRILDATTKRKRAVLKAHADWVATVAIAPDSTWLAMGGWDGRVRIWDAATGRERIVLKGHTGQVRAVAIAPDGTWLATGSSDQTVRIWNAATGRERAVLEGHTDTVTAIAIAPDGTWLATGSVDRTVGIWDAATGRERIVLKGHTGRVRAVAVAPDGSWLASGSEDRTVRIWDTATEPKRAGLTDHTDLVRAVAVAPDGSWLASVGGDHKVRIWDAATGRKRAVLEGHISWVVAVAVAPDGSWLATGSRDLTARIWDATTGQERAVLNGHTGMVVAVAVAPDGSWLASGSEDRTVRIWDAATGQERAVLKGHKRWVKAVAIAPDGSWLASGSEDRTVRIWDAATGQERAILKGHLDTVTAIAIAPNGSWLATASEDYTVRISDPVTGQERAILEGHTSAVVAVAIAPNGSWLATGSEDRTVRIWDAATGRPRALMRVDNDVMTCAWLSPSALAVGGAAGLYLFGFLAEANPTVAR